MSGLLATVVGSRALPPEPVATDALVHLCSTSRGAGSALEELLSDLCPGSSTDGLVFSGQDIDPTTEGRPDLVATDSSGVRLVIEAKFDAELTVAQVSGAYTRKLTSNGPAALVFLVPGDRMQNVWSRVSVAVGGAVEPIRLAPDEVDAGQAVMPLPSAGHVLAVTSWQSLLNRMQASISKRGETGADAELAQIRGLVEWRSRTGWTPPLPGDLPQRAGSQLAALTQVVKSAAGDVSVKTPRNGSADGGPGRHVTTPAGKSLWVGIWFTWWGARGPGPLWAQIKAKTAHEISRLSEALTTAGIANHLRQHRGDVIMPLMLPDNAEQDATKAAIVDQLRAIAEVVDSLGVEVIEADDDVAGGAESDGPARLPI